MGQEAIALGVERFHAKLKGHGLQLAQEGIDVIGDELMFTLDLMVENELSGEARSSVISGQTLDDLMRIAQNQDGNYNVENALNGIANNVINNPLLVAVNRLVDFKPDMA